MSGKEDFMYFSEHIEELSEKYKGRYIAIKNKEVIGDYSSFDYALEDCLKKHDSGSFIIQKAIKKPQEYYFGYNPYANFGQRFDYHEKRPERMVCTTMDVEED